jgi:hypothetical protein
MRRNPSLLNGTLLPVAAGLILLLGLSLSRLRDPGRVAPRPTPADTNATDHPAAHRTRDLFEWPARVEWLPLTSNGNPFFTLAIQPPPPPKPPPPPPATRKVELTYRGYLETSAGIRRAVIQVADKQVLARVGEPVLAAFNASDIQPNHLVLTSTKGGAPAGTNPPATVKLDFAKTVPLEIPTK